MQLYRDGELFGALTRYTYATPWAEAYLDPADRRAFDRLCRVSHFLNVELEEEWGELTREEEDAEYERRLARLGIIESDVDRFHGSAWEIRDSRTPLAGPITLYECDTDGWIRWRWG